MNFLRFLIFLLSVNSIIYAQQNNWDIDSHNKSKQKYQPKALITNKNLRSNKVTGIERGRYSPSSDLPDFRGRTLGQPGSGAEYEIFIDPIFVDTTVRSQFSNSDEIIDVHNYGATFDPKSIIFTPYDPLLTKDMSYTLDTVWVGGNYQRRGNNVDDTLYVDVVWADTSNTNVFAKWPYASPPLNSYGTFITPRFTTNPILQGNQIRFSAPNSTNRISIKYVLTKADSIYLSTRNFLPIVLNGAAGQLIPANNIVSANVSFNAGGLHSNGVYSYIAGNAVNPLAVSGWGAIHFAQANPPVAALNDIVNGYDDFGVGKNYSTYIIKQGRYGTETGSWKFCTREAPYWGYWIDFSIRYDKTVSVKELESFGFVLGQNKPNPFHHQSTINFQLIKDAKSVTFTVSDIAGKIISSELAPTFVGIHTIKLGSYASGLYYYSLNVDGMTSTKKFIVE